MRRASLFVLSSILALCAAAPCEAQQQIGTISGVVTEPSSGNPVEGARLGITGTQLSGTTNAAGRFTIASVPVGSHVVQIRMIW